MGRHPRRGRGTTPLPALLCKERGSALLWTLERAMGDAWTKDVADAWATAYGTLSGYMIEQAYGRHMPTLLNNVRFQDKCSD